MVSLEQFSKAYFAGTNPARVVFDYAAVTGAVSLPTIGSTFFVSSGSEGGTVIPVESELAGDGDLMSMSKLDPEDFVNRSELAVDSVLASVLIMVGKTRFVAAPVVKGGST